MINDKTVAIVLPAYNAARTLQGTVDELPAIVDYRIFVDDGSSDETVALTKLFSGTLRRRQVPEAGPEGSLASSNASQLRRV